MTDFKLDPRLAADTLMIGDLTVSRVLLMNDSRFPWLILVPRRAAMRDMIDLDPTDRVRVRNEVDAVCLVMKRLFSPIKLNVAALGNVVPQLHVHMIARFEADDAWPKPVWGLGVAVPYEASEGKALTDRISRELGRL